MTTDLEVIAAGHQCRLIEPGYYWARLIVWEESVKARVQRRSMGTPPRSYPMLCNPSIVELWRLGNGNAHVHAGEMGRTRVGDWLFLAKVEPVSGYVVPVNNAAHWSEQALRELSRPSSPRWPAHLSATEHGGIDDHS